MASESESVPAREFIGACHDHRRTGKPICVVRSFSLDCPRTRPGEHTHTLVTHARAILFHSNSFTSARARASIQINSDSDATRMIAYDKYIAYTNETTMAKRPAIDFDNESLTIANGANER